MNVAQAVNPNGSRTAPERLYSPFIRMVGVQQLVPKKPEDKRLGRPLGKPREDSWRQTIFDGLAAGKCDIQTLRTRCKADRQPEKGSFHSAVSQMARRGEIARIGFFPNYTYRNLTK